MNDQNFKNSNEYKSFLEANSGEGVLDIRVYTASGAIPISNLKVIVSKIVGNTNVIFFEGYSDSSGIIESIKLPAPKIKTDDLKIPSSAEYNISANYIPDNVNENFKVEIYDGIRVIQNINILPKNKVED